MNLFTCYKKCLLFSALFFTLKFSSLAQTPVFFGMANEGGTHLSGVIFRFDPVTGKDSVVWNFGSGSDGVNCYGDLIYYPANGLFYGLTVQGGRFDGGTIFSFNPKTFQETVLWNLGNGVDGQFPWGSLTYDNANGLFYATTDMGGDHGSGAIISFNPVNNEEKVVWSFFGGAKDGQYPVGNVSYDTNGMLYTMTNYGGAIDSGIIARYNPVTNKDTAAWTFGNGTDGTAPYGALTYNPGNGLFYGMTFLGGTNNAGTIISFNPATNAESVVWNFGNGTDGMTPFGSFTYDAGKSLFYGMTYKGGTNNQGTIISFNPANNQEKVLYNFGNNGDGQQPFASFTYNPHDGLYYATTYQGGSHTQGAIISFNTTTNRDSVLYSFLNFSTDGYQPQSSLTLYDPEGVSGIKFVTNPPFSIYPNPTNGLFYINGLRTGQIIELYNYSGQKESSMKAGNATEQLNLSGFSNGIYFVRVLNADRALVEQQKIVKAN